MVLVALVVLGYLVAFHLLALEGLVALLLVVLEALEVYLLMALEGLVTLLLVVSKAPEVYLPGVSKGLVVHLLVVPMVLVVSEALVVLLSDNLVVLMVQIPEINPLREYLRVVLHHNNLSISLLMVLLVLICHINTTSTCNLIIGYLS